MPDARALLRPIITDALRQFETAGDRRSRDYATRPSADCLPAPPVRRSSRGDLVDLAAAECGRLLGEATGQALRRELEERFHAQTANHLGVDFHPEFFQAICCSPWAAAMLCPCSAAAACLPTTPPFHAGCCSAGDSRVTTFLAASGCR